MYKLAIIISSLSALFGLLREILIVYLLGFSFQNDQLQAYLSIPYILLLSIDALKLGSLNLFAHLPLLTIIGAASVLILPLSLLVTLVVGMTMKEASDWLLFISFLGAYLNLVAIIIITHKQKGGKFFAAQLINVIPNLILIPCLLISYYKAPEKLIFYMVIFSSFIPVLQLALLWFVKVGSLQKAHRLPLFEAVMIFVRHMASAFPAQVFQTLARSLTYHYDAGYLSIFSFTNRVYSSFKFILTDSFVGLRLAKKEEANLSLIDELFSNKKINIFLAFGTLLFLLIFSEFNGKIYFCLELFLLCCIGFYFDFLLKIRYFNINDNRHNKKLIILYSLYEWFFAIVGYGVTVYLLHLPIWYMFAWFLLRPFSEIFLLTKEGGSHVKTSI